MGQAAAAVLWAQMVPSPLPLPQEKQTSSGPTVLFYLVFIFTAFAFA